METKRRLEQINKLLGLIDRHKQRCARHGHICLFAIAFEKMVMDREMRDLAIVEAMMRVDERIGEIVKCQS